MADSSTNIDGIQQSLGSQDLAANAYFDAASPATLYGRRMAGCSGLVWAYYGGKVSLNGVITAVANGTISLSPSVTNYIEANPVDGTVSKNTTGFTAGRTPLYTVVAGASTVTSYTDHRLNGLKSTGILIRAFPTDANYTLTVAEAANEIISITAGVITATRNLVVPLTIWEKTITNNTAQSVQVIGATGTGVTIATGKTACVYSNGTNIIRATADV